MKLWLVVIKDKELAGEPDVGVGMFETDDVSEVESATCAVLEALASRGRGRCVARRIEIERSKFYRATMWFRTAP